MRPAIALVEFNSISRGIKNADFMVKKAPVRLLEARTVCPGKYIVLVAGDVDPVMESHKAGLESGGEFVVDDLLLPNAHESLIPAMEACVEPGELDAIAIVETFSVASALLAADASAKMADVRLLELRLANGLGGKSFYVITGEIGDIESAVTEGVKAIEHLAAVVNTEIIPRPHADLLKKLF